MFDRIVFDLDGTLSDPLLGIGRSINHALVHHGFPELAMAALSRYVGPPIDETFATLTGRSDPVAIAAFVEKFRERYGETGYAENVLYPGIADVLSELRASGIPLALCTSKRQDFAEKILEMFGLREHFDLVSGGDVGVHKWQQMAALRAEGHVSAATLMVGDRANDLVAAHRNGMAAAGVLWGYGSREELAAEQPRYLLESPVELLRFRR
jgi:phosphoglycolate phosphatase